MPLALTGGALFPASNTETLSGGGSSRGIGIS
jgi:hypothetical protein